MLYFKKICRKRAVFHSAFLTLFLGAFLSSCGLQNESVRERNHTTESLESEDNLFGIIDGNPASDIVLRSTIGIGDADGRHFCSGTILSQKHILSAAHCFEENADFVFFGRDISASQKRKIVHVYRDRLSNYDYRKLDLAIAEFQGGLPPGFTSANLPQASRRLPTGTKVIVAGYGRQEARGSVSPHLLQYVGQVRKEQHSSEWTDRVNLSSIFRQFYFEIANRNTRQACFGDSGGPNFLKIGNKLEVVGVNQSTLERDCSTGSVSVHVPRNLNWIYSKVPELAKINQQQDANAISNSLQTETQVIHFFDFKMQQNTKLLTTNKATSVVLVNQGVDRPCKDSFDPYAKFYRLTLPKTTDGQSASNSFRVSVNIVENLSASGVGNGALKVQATRDNSENGRRLVDVQFCRTGGGISFVRQFSLAAIENIVQQTNAPQPAVNVDTRRELAQEGQVLKAAANTLIAYGKKGFSRWFFKRMPASGELLISNSTFGDPLPGVRKAAYLVNE